MHSISSPLIPQGSYCYTYSGTGKFALCPHFVGRDVNGVTLPFCTFLNKGSVPGSLGSLSEIEQEQLKEAWGTEKWTDPTTQEVHETFIIPEKWDLFLLWDQCKECGQNDKESSYWGRTQAQMRSSNKNHAYPWFTFDVDITASGGAKDKSFNLTLTVPKKGSLSTKVAAVIKQLHKLSAVLRDLNKSTFHSHTKWAIQVSTDKPFQIDLGKTHYSQYNSNIVRVAAQLTRTHTK